MNFTQKDRVLGNGFRANFCVLSLKCSGWKEHGSAWRSGKELKQTELNPTNKSIGAFCVESPIEIFYFES